MLGHKRSLHKFLKDRNCTKYLLQLQWNENRNQQQKEIWKIHESVEIKQHAPN